jgi:hypothetical protein
MPRIIYDEQCTFAHIIVDELRQVKMNTSLRTLLARNAGFVDSKVVVFSKYSLKIFDLKEDINAEKARLS